MPKTVLRLKADRQTLAQGTSAEVLALLAQFKSPATALDNNGRLLKHVLWQRWDSLDVVAIAQKAGLILDTGDVFEATHISGDVDGATAQIVIDRLMSFERAGFSLTAADGEGRTLMHRMAHGFHPAIMAFLEDQGLDPLTLAPSQNGGPAESAFSIVFHETDRAMDNSPNDFARLLAERHSGLPASRFLSALASSPAGICGPINEETDAPAPDAQSLASFHAPTTRSRASFFSESFSNFLEQASREMAQAQNKRIAWLEHCVKMGGQLPASRPASNDQKRWAIFLAHQAGQSDASLAGAGNESRLRAHLEAVALRHEMDQSDESPQGDSAPSADGQSLRRAPARKAPRI